MNEINYMYNYKLSIKSGIEEHLPTLKKYATECKHVTEFGVKDGNSTWALLAGKPEKMVSYDLNYEPYKKEIDEIINKAHEAKIDYKFINANTLTIDIDPTDLLFIDTTHHYLHLIKELYRHGNKVNKFILIHDTTYCGEVSDDWTTPGLNKAIEGFIADNKHWKIKEVFTNNNGLTVLQRTEKGLENNKETDVNFELYKAPGKGNYLFVKLDKTPSENK